METETKKSAILRKVQALLAQADGTPFTEEADTFRQKADELMTLYAIEEFELDRSGQAKKEEITSRKVFVVKAGSVVHQPLVDLASTIARHCRVRIVYYGLRAQGRSDVEATIVGFPSDLDFYELLHTSLHLKIATDLEPKYDTTQTVGWNVKRMKEAGMKWERIAQLCGDGQVTPKWIGLYKKQCKLEGTEPMKTMPSVWVRNFAEGFVVEISQRLAAMRRQTEENLTSTGHDLVLFKDRDVEVAEAFQMMFPRLSNVPAKSSGKFDGRARSAGAKSGATADLSGGRHSAGSGARKELN